MPPTAAITRIAGEPGISRATITATGNACTNDRTSWRSHQVGAVASWSTQSRYRGGRPPPSAYQSQCRGSGRAGRSSAMPPAYVRARASPALQESHFPAISASRVAVGVGVGAEVGVGVGAEVGVEVDDVHRGLLGRRRATV